MIVSILQAEVYSILGILGLKCNFQIICSNYFHVNSLGRTPILRTTELGIYDWLANKTYCFLSLCSSITLGKEAERREQRERALGAGE